MAKEFQQHDKKILILRAAVKVFSKKGFHLAKIEEIAEEAGVGKGTIYEYFNSKKNLFEEMFIRINELYFKNINEFLDSDKEVKEKIFLFIYTHLKFISEHKDMAKIMMNEHHLFSEKIMQKTIKQRQKLIKNIEEVVSQGVATGEIAVPEPWLIAQIIGGITMNISSNIIFEEIDKELTEIAQKATDILWIGISAKKDYQTWEQE
ncbi:MAG: transcriptional regulator, TetR family [Clostridiales bacterium]|jgi:TetR/AcrR family fatty acid metabolism transcriptional regulator|nr:transcriptional regulator, TetR family [Clostridiales bacterium]